MRLIENWHTELLRLWSMRVLLFWTVFWAAFGGIYLILPAFIGVIPLPILVALAVLMPVTIALARLLKQPGLD